MLREEGQGVVSILSYSSTNKKTEKAPETNLKLIKIKKILINLGLSVIAFYSQVRFNGAFSLLYKEVQRAGDYH